ncbi:MAG: helix-turn-helix domain-containing protein [Filomicrobium sp.]
MSTQRTLSPITFRIADAVKVSGLGRTKLYELIKTGQLKSVRVGGRRLIDAASLRSLLLDGEVHDD